MEINYLVDEKRCEIWLTGAEAADSALRASLKSLYRKNKREGILSVVFASGKDDLYMNMLALLRYNKRRPAELALQNEKQKADIRTCCSVEVK